MRWVLLVWLCLFCGCAGLMPSASPTVPTRQYQPPQAVAKASTTTQSATAGQARMKESSSEEVARETVQVTRNYWHHMLVADLASVGLGAALFFTLDGRQRAYAVLPVIAGTSIAHIANGNPDNALYSILMRAGGPIAGVLAGVVLLIAGASQCDGSDEPKEECLEKNEFTAWMGVVMGIASGPTLDYVLLSSKTEFVSRPVSKTTGLTIRPRVGYTRGGMTVGLHGTF